MKGSRILLASRKGLIQLQRANGTWQFDRLSHDGAPTSYTIHDPRTNTLWACIDHGHWGSKLHRSQDWGKTWTEIEAPKYPENAEKSYGFNQVDKGKPAILKYLWVVQPGGEDQPNRIYIGTVPGGLFVSDDNGDSFQLNEGLWNHPSRLEHWFGGGMNEPGIHSVVVDPRDSQHLFVAISCAGVFESKDGGSSWEAKNKGLRADFLPDPEAEYGHDPHFMDVCRSEPDVLWQQNHCGIFRTENGGAQWEMISQKGNTAHFGFAVSADPKCGKTAWVVPAMSDEVRRAKDYSICVCRTEDGGKTWQELRNGLPQEQCFDITYRHALDYCGDKLVFGTTTGNVYFSEDRGDTWTCLGNHFPPIYAVRFA